VNLVLNKLKRCQRLSTSSLSKGWRNITF